jgi:hypothetical protein
MSRFSDEEREALRLAAQAAVPVLAKLEREYADLGRRISLHKATIAEYETSLGRRPRNPASVSVEGNGNKTPRGQVVEHIDAVLISGVGLVEPDLRKQVNERYGTAYTRASIYSVLQRGYRVGKYEMRPDKTWWRKKTEGVKQLLAG